MKRIRSLTPLFLTVGPLAALVLVVGGAAALWLSLRSEVQLTSPGGRYAVLLAGRFGRPAFLLDHSVYATVFDKGNKVVADRKIYTGDWIDPSFDIKYPRRIWVNDTILRFTHPADEALDEHDQITVHNSTSGKIGLLQIQSRDMFLVLDLAPGETTTLRAPKQSRYAGHSWIDLDGQFSDGREVQYIGKNFSVAGPTGYTINVWDDRVELRMDAK